MFRTMREAQLESGFFGQGTGSSTYEGLFETHLAGSVSRNSPFGIARMLEERWADAVVAWMSATDTFIDVYEEYVPVWTEEDLDADLASMEIRMARIFNEAE